MESRIIYHIEKYISFLFGPENGNDSEQQLYNKLLRSEGEELEVWANYTLKEYITGKLNVYGISGFKAWYYLSTDVMGMDEIYGEELSFNEEYHTIKEKIENFQMEKVDYRHRTDWQFGVIIDYMEMLIMEKSPEDLKSYIIQLVDPIEIC